MPINRIVLSDIAVGRKIGRDYGRAHAQSFDERQTIPLGMRRHEETFRMTYQAPERRTRQASRQNEVVLNVTAPREKMQNPVPAPRRRTNHNEFGRLRAAPTDQFPPDIDEKRMIFAWLERSADNKIVLGS